MDPNLNFRFMVPGWIGLSAFVAILVASGRLQTVLARTDGREIAAVIMAFAVALLGAPAAGFLLNSLVVWFCNACEIGPNHSPVFTRFKHKVQHAIASTPEFQSLRKALPDLRANSIAADFEYRVDTGPLLEWRRRQRGAFFANWASIVAISLAIVFALRWDWRVLAASAVTYVIFAELVLMVFLGCNAQKSKRVADDQQRVWVESLTSRDIVRFLRSKGKGMGDGDKGPYGRISRRPGKRVTYIK